MRSAFLQSLQQIFSQKEALSSHYMTHGWRRNPMKPDSVLYACVLLHCFAVWRIISFSDADLNRNFPIHQPRFEYPMMHGSCRNLVLFPAISRSDPLCASSDFSLHQTTKLYILFHSQSVTRGPAVDDMGVRQKLSKTCPEYSIFANG
jgi:hypothetical protein